jgi:selenophosphate synthetase-related protein
MGADEIVEGLQIERDVFARRMRGCDTEDGTDYWRQRVQLLDDAIKFIQDVQSARQGDNVVIVQNGGQQRLHSIGDV